MICVFFCSITLAQTKDGRTQVQKSRELSIEELKQIWSSIKNSKINKQFKDGSIDSWGDVARIIFDELQKIQSCSNQREAFQFYINQFGKHGAQADFRWLFALRSQGLTADRSVAPPSREKKKVERRRSELLVAELQVRMFLKSPELLARYYHSVAWFNFMFGEYSFPFHLHKCYQCLHEGERSDEYWWFAQNFLIMLHATGRDDLLKGAKPEDLKPQFKKWSDWLIENGMYLRPSKKTHYWVLDEGEKARKEGYVPFVLNQKLPPLVVRPKYPFPDWKGPSPAKPQDYFEME